MGVFPKARSYCSAFMQLEDYQRVKDMSDQWMKGAEPFIATRGKGYRKPIPFREVIETNGALALWITAHDICARREGRQRERFFDTRKVRAELERLDSLMFDGWEYDASMDEWCRSFLNKTDFVDCAKAHDAVLCKGYQWIGYMPPTPEEGLKMVFSVAVMNVYDQVREFERDPVAA